MSPCNPEVNILDRESQSIVGGNTGGIRENGGIPRIKGWVDLTATVVGRENMVGIYKRK